MTKRRINPVKAGLAGAAIVAAGAAAVVLSKKENRKKAGKAFNKLKVKGAGLRKKAASRLDKIIAKEEKKLDKASRTLTGTHLSA